MFVHCLGKRTTAGCYLSLFISMIPILITYLMNNNREIGYKNNLNILSENTFTIIHLYFCLFIYCCTGMSISNMRSDM